MSKQNKSNTEGNKNIIIQGSDNNEINININASPKKESNSKQTINPIKDEFKELIVKAEYQKLFEELLKYTKNNSSDLYNEVIMYFSRFNTLKTESRIGILSKEDESLEMNKIRNSLLELIDRI